MYVASSEMPARPLENARMVRSLPRALKNGKQDSAIHTVDAAFDGRVASFWQESPSPEKATPFARDASATTILRL